MRKCANCGAVNADNLESCGNCGKSLSGTSDAEEADKSESRGAQASSYPVGSGRSIDFGLLGRQDESILSIALNIRRIFILLLYFVIVTVASYLFGLWVSAFDPSASGFKGAAIGLIFVLSVLGIAILYVAVYRKRLTRE